MTLKIGIAVIAMMLSGSAWAQQSYEMLQLQGANRSGEIFQEPQPQEQQGMRQQQMDRDAQDLQQQLQLQQRQLELNALSVTGSDCSASLCPNGE